MTKTKPGIRDVLTQGVCELIRGIGQNPLERVCDKPAMLRYPAQGGGYMRLCVEHGEQHRRYCGEWTGTEWTASPWEEPASAQAS